MFEGEISRGLTDVLYLAFEHFPGPYLLAIPVGLVILARRYDAKQSWCFFTMLVLNTGFFAVYDTWDRYAFLLPSFIMVAFAGSLAVDALWDRLKQADAGAAGGYLRAATRGVLVASMLFSLAFPPWFYSKLAEWGTRPGLWSRRYDSEFHGNIVNFAEYLANPNKRHWRDAEEYANLLFEKLPKGAVYIDDDSRTYFPVQYFRRYYHRRLDLKIFMVNSWDFSDWGLDRRDFEKELLLARRSPGNLFLPSLRSPFRQLLPRNLDGSPPEFQLFPLDERRYIYRLLTATELANPARDRSSDVRVR
jgi:hypothetical protein